MHAVTNEQIRLLDEETIRKHVPGLTLMERAGHGIFEAILELAGDMEELCVSIFLGRGNNAGDGLVVARLLAERGVRCMLHYLHEPAEMSPDTFKNYVKLAKFRKEGLIEEIAIYLSGWEDKVIRSFGESDLILDALLGTGINSPVREAYARVIALINNSSLPVMSVDIPSGVNGTTGEVMGKAVMADITVSLALPKMGSIFYPGKAYTGSLEVVDIGIPADVIDAAGIDNFVLNDMAAVADLPQHGPQTHKFQRGALLLVAGSRRYSGAACLSSISALRSGCGIVYLAGPESIRTIVQGAWPEIIFISLPETGEGTVAASALEEILSVRCDAVAVGPGMTTEEETASLVRDLVGSCRKALLLDADGINAFEGRYGEIRDLSAGRNIILSPHSGELKRLTGMDVPDSPAGRIEALRGLVAGSSVTLVHKGAPTLIAHPEGRIDINVHGHPGLATAGSGDVLTGAIAGMLAQGAAPGEAARAGVYIHSRAAEIASQLTGERGMIAGDCSDSLPAALRELEQLAG